MAADRHEVRRVDVGDGIYVRVPVPQLALVEAAASGARPGQTDTPSTAATAVRSRATWAVPLAAMPAAGAVAAVVLVRHGPTTRGLMAAGVVAMLVLLAAIDLRWRVIPNRIVLPATGAVLAWQFAFVPDRSLEWIAAAVGSAGFLALPSLIRPGAVGMGDVKLAALLGAALGANVVGALLLGFLATTPVTLAMLARRGTAARKATIPLAPFLALGATVVQLS
ncbi:MAG: A24 family peptidase [Actinomycetota bacterium]|nr:A24 family peptidase [Actinomycetota bacterium]